jgi:HD-GYP domain-containing protein (c-di-GMP phosphodiesterase class II)
LVTGHAHDILAVADGASVWDEALAREPGPFLILQDEELDRAMAAIGDFADLSSPYLAGHSSGVAALAVRAAERCRLDAGTPAMLRRAAFMYDLGRVIVPVRVWQKPQAHDR